MSEFADLKERFAELLVGHAHDPSEERLQEAGAVARRLLELDVPTYSLADVCDGAIRALAEADPDRTVERVAPAVSEILSELLVRCGLSLDALRAATARHEAQSVQWVRAVSHDLKAPLNTIHGYAQHLRDVVGDRADEEASHCIDRIEQGVLRMGEMIDALARLGRVGAAAAQAGDADCEAAAASALQNLDAHIRDSGARVQLDPLPMVRAVPGELVLVFQNLIGNAIKYRGDATPEIHVSARKGHQSVTISVADNGIGFDPEAAERVFDVFERLHPNGPYPGTGVGLAIVKKIVENQGGRVFAASEPGVGSTFSFTLPAASAS